MPITHISQLAENATFRILQEAQDRMDAADPTLGAFTRSYWHIMAFLVAYAGLDSTQKTALLSNLDTNIATQPWAGELDRTELTQEKLDQLVGSSSVVGEMDWAQLFKASPEDSSVAFTFSVELLSPEELQAALQRNCPSLAVAFPEQSVFTIEEGRNAHEVKFTTKVTETETWVQPFEGTNRWMMQGEMGKRNGPFEVSDALQEKINKLNSDEALRLGNFIITKHAGGGSKQQLIVPGRDYFIEKNGQVNEGIYIAFKGLRNVYGLTQVDDVEVNLNNKASFYKAGASAESKQEVILVARGGGMRRDPEVGITIAVDEALNAYFSGMAMGVKFDGHRDEPTEDLSSYFIELKTKSGVSVLLLAQPYMPIKAHLCENKPLSPLAISDAVESAKDVQTEVAPPLRSLGLSDGNLKVEEVNPNFDNDRPVKEAKNHTTLPASNWHFCANVLFSLSVVGGAALFTVFLAATLALSGMVAVLAVGAALAGAGVGGLLYNNLFNQPRKQASPPEPELPSVSVVPV